MTFFSVKSPNPVWLLWTTDRKTCRQVVFAHKLFKCVGLLFQRSTRCSSC